MSLNRYYNKEASLYEEKRKGHIWDNENSTMQFLLNDKNITNILDIPCGTGRYFNFYEEKNISYIGMDISKDMLQIAQNRSNNGTIINKNLWELTAEDVGNIDCIVCCRFLHWLSSEKCEELMNLFHSLLSSKIIIFTDIVGENTVKYKSGTYIHSEEDFAAYTNNLSIIHNEILNKNSKNNSKNIMIKGLFN